MSITDSDYLTWYNQEINRYRDHEWRLPSFSLALTYAVVLFARNNDTKSLFPPSYLALSIIVFVILMVIAETHTHIKLNEFRNRRDLLLEGKNHFKVKTHPFQNLVDFIYFFGFVVVPSFVGIVAACALSR